MFHQEHERYVYQSDVYRVAFNHDGVMSSLQVKGHEFLRPLQGEVGGAGFFLDGKRISLPSVQANPTGGLIADGVNGIFLNLLPDRIDLDIGQEDAGKTVEYVLYPAADITITPVEKPVFRGRRNEPWQIIGTQATRWTAPDGTSIEVHYDCKALRYNGLPAMVVDDPYKTRICGEFRFSASAWSSGTAAISWQGKPDDHNYPAGTPIDITGTVTWNGATLPTAPVEMVVQFEDMNTLDDVGAWRQRVTFTKKTESFAFSIPWSRPGPWRLHVMAVQGDHAVGLKSGVIVYDLPRYLPPLNRPRDFWRFWEGALAEQRRFPLDAVLMKDDKASTPDYTIYTVYITGYAGRRLQGKYGEPNAPGRYPVTLGAGHPGANVTAPEDPHTCFVVSAMDGMATFRTGLGDRRTSNLFYNYVDALRWVDFVATREKADLQRSIYYAGSRSGPIGLAMLALDPRVQMYIANVPTNNRWDWQVTQPGAGGWGPWATDRKPGQSLDAFCHELSYFNPDNFADRVTQPVLIGCGLLDGLSQITGNLACYSRLASPQKKICLRAWWGHMDANKDWYDTSAAWRKALFAGK
jgi:cephalosporin-C deacetylase